MCHQSHMPSSELGPRPTSIPHCSCLCRPLDCTSRFCHVWISAQCTVLWIDLLETANAFRLEVPRKQAEAPDALFSSLPYHTNLVLSEKRCTSVMLLLDIVGARTNAQVMLSKQSMSTWRHRCISTIRTGQSPKNALTT